MSHAHNRLDPALAAGNRKSLAGYQAQHFTWSVADAVATITLNRPERKNPLTFDSYAELRDLFGHQRIARRAAKSLPDTVYKSGTENRYRTDNKRKERFRCCPKARAKRPFDAGNGRAAGFPVRVQPAKTAKARTGKVPKPFTFGGTAQKRKLLSGNAPRLVICSTIGMSAPRSVVWMGRERVRVSSIL